MANGCDLLHKRSSAVGRYVALNVTGSGQPGFAPFTVTQSPSPAALPPAAATQTAIEFGFRGPIVLHDGTTVRAQNHGWLAHMIDLTRVPHAVTGAAVMALLQAGKDNQAFKLLGPNPAFVTLRMAQSSPTFAPGGSAGRYRWSNLRRSGWGRLRRRSTLPW